MSRSALPRQPLRSQPPQQQLLSPQQQQAEMEAAAAAADCFDLFSVSATMRHVLMLHRAMCDAAGMRPAPLNEFYPKLKTKVRSWKAQALWKKFDARAAHRAYAKGNACTGTRVLVIGAGPCGLRTAIEAQLLGAKVVVVEKRERISRNNVLHLWPFVITDLRNLGAKKFYGKFCAGSIDHISIRQLQCILLKVALLLGVEVHVGVSFEHLVEPTGDGYGWRAAVTPSNHNVSHYEFDVLIGADGKRNTLEGFKRKEFRGKLAIAITANFINKKTEAEAKAEEISGVAFIFNQSFFKELYHTTGIDLENIVYYKDETHYFVMTAKKHSLIDKGVIMHDFGDPAELLAPANVNTEKLLGYAREAANFSTKYQMPDLEFAVNHYGKPDVAMFDFTSMFAAETSCRVVVRKGHRLLQCLVGDSLLEPFWPTGSGCARGFLSSMDAAYAIKLWSNRENSTLGVLAQRESIYRLLNQTTPENLHRDIGSYTVDPATRYPNLNRSSVNAYQVKHLIDTDDMSILDETFMDPQPAIADDPVRRKRRHDADSIPLNEVILRWFNTQLQAHEQYEGDLKDVADIFKDGKALCALINRYRPDLIDFTKVKELSPLECNEIAFTLMENELNIPRVISAADSLQLQDIESSLPLLEYLLKLSDMFRGEVPYVTYPKPDFEELREKYRTHSNRAQFDFTKLLQYSTKPKVHIPVQDVVEGPQMVQRRSVLDEERAKRPRRHEGSPAVPSGSQHQAQQNETPRRAKKRRSADKTNIEERQKRLQEIEVNRQDRMSKRRQQRYQQTQNFYKSLHMLQANTLLREGDENSPFEDYSIFLYRQQAPVFNDRVKELERKLLYPDRDRSDIPSALPRTSPDEQFNDRIKSMEQRISSRNTYGTEKKPKDLMRAIGKIDSTDWNVREIEKKIEQSKKTEIHGPKGREKVPKWSKEQFMARQNKMSKPNRQDSTEEKYKEIDQTLKNLDKQLKEGSVLEVGERGRNKVASIAGQFVKKDDNPTNTSEDKNPSTVVPKSSSKVALAFKKQAASEKCHFCRQTVYLMEKITAENLIMHRSCLKCHHCHANLRQGGYAFDRDDPHGYFYCTQHFKLPAKAIRPVARKPGQRKPTQHQQAAAAATTLSATVPGDLLQTPDKLRGHAANVAQLELLDRGQTPERIEFENTDAMSDGEPSEEHIIDEHEWSGRNFLPESNNDSESEISSSDESDNESDSDMFQEAIDSPLGAQTLQLATDWIGKQNYTDSEESVDDFYDSSEGIADDGKDDTEGEEFKKARELRRQEVRLLPLPANLPTDTETEKQLLSENPANLEENKENLHGISNSNQSLNVDRQSEKSFNSEKSFKSANSVGSASNVTKADMEKLEQHTERKFSADIEAISEKLYRMNNVMKMNKDLEALAKEELVKSDILKKLTMKEKWLADNSVGTNLNPLAPKSKFDTKGLQNQGASNLEGTGASKTAEVATEGMRLETQAEAENAQNSSTESFIPKANAQQAPPQAATQSAPQTGPQSPPTNLSLQQAKLSPTSSPHMETKADPTNLSRSNSLRKSKLSPTMEKKQAASLSRTGSFKSNASSSPKANLSRNNSLRKSSKIDLKAALENDSKMQLENILDIVKKMDIKDKPREQDIGQMLYEAETKPTPPPKPTKLMSAKLKQIEAQSFAGTMDSIKAQLDNVPTMSTGLPSSVDLAKYFPNQKNEKSTAGASNKTQQKLKDVDLAKYFPASPQPQRRAVVTVADKLKKSQTEKQVGGEAKAPVPVTKMAPKRQASLDTGAKYSLKEHQLDGSMDLKKQKSPVKVTTTTATAATTKKGNVKIIKKIVPKGTKARKAAEAAAKAAAADPANSSPSSGTNAKASLVTRDESELIFDELLHADEQAMRSPSLEYQRLFNEEKSPSDDISDKIEHILEETGIDLGIPKRSKDNSKKLLKAKSLGEGEFQLKSTKPDDQTKEDGDLPKGVQNILKRFESMSSMTSSENLKLRRVESSTSNLHKSRESIISHESDSLSDLEKTMEYLKSEWKNEATNFLQKKRDNFYSQKRLAEEEAASEQKKSRTESLPLQYRESKLAKFFGIKPKSPEKQKKRKSPENQKKAKSPEKKMALNKRTPSSLDELAQVGSARSLNKGKLKASDIIAKLEKNITSTQTPKVEPTSRQNSLAEASVEPQRPTNEALTLPSEHVKKDSTPNDFEALKATPNNLGALKATPNNLGTLKATPINLNDLEALKTTSNNLNNSENLKATPNYLHNSESLKTTPNNLNSLETLEATRNHAEPSHYGTNASFMQTAASSLLKNNSENLQPTHEDSSSKLNSESVSKNIVLPQQEQKIAYSEAFKEKLEQTATTSTANNARTDTTSTPHNSVLNSGSRLSRQNSQNSASSEKLNSRPLVEDIKNLPKTGCDKSLNSSRRGSQNSLHSRRASDSSLQEKLDSLANQILETMATTKDFNRDSVPVISTDALDECDSLCTSISKSPSLVPVTVQLRGSSEDESIEKLFGQFSDDMLVDVEFDSNDELVEIKPRPNFHEKENKSIERDYVDELESLEKDDITVQTNVQLLAEESHDLETNLIQDDVKLHETLFPIRPQRRQKSTSSSSESAAPIAPQRLKKKLSCLSPENMPPSVQDILQAVYRQVEYENQNERSRKFPLHENEAEKLEADELTLDRIEENRENIEDNVREVQPTSRRSSKTSAELADMTESLEMRNKRSNNTKSEIPLSSESRQNQYDLKQNAQNSSPFGVPYIPNGSAPSEMKPEYTPISAPQHDNRSVYRPSKAMNSDHIKRPYTSETSDRTAESPHNSNSWQHELCSNTDSEHSKTEPQHSTEYLQNRRASNKSLKPTTESENPHNSELESEILNNVAYLQSRQNLTKFLNDKKAENRRNSESEQKIRSDTKIENSQNTESQYGDSSIAPSSLLPLNPSTNRRPSHTEDFEVRNNAENPNTSSGADLLKPTQSDSDLNTASENNAQNPASQLRKISNPTNLKTPSETNEQNPASEDRKTSDSTLQITSNNPYLDNVRSKSPIKSNLYTLNPHSKENSLEWNMEHLPLSPMPRRKKSEIEHSHNAESTQYGDSLNATSNFVPQNLPTNRRPSDTEDIEVRNNAEKQNHMLKSTVNGSDLNTAPQTNKHNPASEHRKNSESSVETTSMRPKSPIKSTLYTLNPHSKENSLEWNMEHLPLSPMPRRKYVHPERGTNVEVKLRDVSPTSSIKMLNNLHIIDGSEISEKRAMDDIEKERLQALLKRDQSYQEMTKDEPLLKSADCCRNTSNRATPLAIVTPTKQSQTPVKQSPRGSIISLGSSNDSKRSGTPPMFKTLSIPSDEEPAPSTSSRRSSFALIELLGNDNPITAPMPKKLEIPLAEVPKYIPDPTEPVDEIFKNRVWPQSEAELMAEAESKALDTESDEEPKENSNPSPVSEIFKNRQWPDGKTDFTKLPAIEREYEDVGSFLKRRKAERGEVVEREEEQNSADGKKSEISNADVEENLMKMDSENKTESSNALKTDSENITESSIVLRNDFDNIKESSYSTKNDSENTSTPKKDSENIKTPKSILPVALKAQNKEGSLEWTMENMPPSPMPRRKFVHPERGQLNLRELSPNSSIKVLNNLRELTEHENEASQQRKIEDFERQRREALLERDKTYQEITKDDPVLKSTPSSVINTRQNTPAKQSANRDKSFASSRNASKRATPLRPASSRASMQSNITSSNRSGTPPMFKELVIPEADELDDAMSMTSTRSSFAVIELLGNDNPIIAPLPKPLVLPQPEVPKYIPDPNEPVDEVFKNRPWPKPEDEILATLENSESDDEEPQTRVSVSSPTSPIDEELSKQRQWPDGKTIYSKEEKRADSLEQDDLERLLKRRQHQYSEVQKPHSQSPQQKRRFNKNLAITPNKASSRSATDLNKKNSPLGSAYSSAHNSVHSLVAPRSSQDYGLSKLRAEQAGRSADMDAGTKILLDRGKHLHNRKRDFVNDRAAERNPYLKEAFKEERLERRLSDEAQESLNSFRPTHYSSTKAAPRFPTSRALGRSSIPSATTYDYLGVTPSYSDLLGSSSSRLPYTPTRYQHYSTPVASTYSSSASRLNPLRRTSPADYSSRLPSTSKESCVQSDSESTSPDEVELNSATEISTDSEFEQDEQTRETPKIFIDDTHLRKPTKVQVKSTVIASTAGQKYNAHPHHNKVVNKHPVQHPPPPQFKPLVQVDPTVLSTSRTPLQNPRPGDYLLNKTASTEGIASKKSLELKKRYLLGEPANGNKIQKSGSTSVLDSKIRSFQSNISECQKLLNPGSGISPTMKTFLERANNNAKNDLMRSATSNVLNDLKVEITIQKASSTASTDNEKENVFVNSKNELNKGMEYSETVNTALLETLNNKASTPPKQAIIETIDLVTPEKTAAFIDLTKLETSVKLLNNMQVINEETKPISPQLLNADSNKIIDLTCDSPARSERTLIEDATPDLSKDVRACIPDLLGHIEQEVKVVKVNNFGHEDQLRLLPNSDDEEKQDSPEKLEDNIENETLQIEVPNIPWQTRKKPEISSTTGSSCTSTSSSVEDIQHYILESTTSPDTQTSNHQVPRVEIHDTSGTLMQIDSLMIIDGKYIGDPEDLKYMELPEGVIVPVTPALTTQELEDETEVDVEPVTATPEPAEYTVIEADLDVPPPLPEQGPPLPAQGPPKILPTNLKFDTKNENKLQSLKNLPLIVDQVPNEHTKAVKPITLNLNSAQKPNSKASTPKTQTPNTPTSPLVDNDRTPTAELMSRGSDTETEATGTGQVYTETELSDWTADDCISENFIDMEFVNSQKDTIKRNKRGKKKLNAPKLPSTSEMLHEVSRAAPVAEFEGILKNIDIDDIEFMDTGSEGSCAEAYAATNTALLRNRGYVEIIEKNTPEPPVSRNMPKSTVAGASYKPITKRDEKLGIDYIEQGAYIMQGENSVHDMLKTPVNESPQLSAVLKSQPSTLMSQSLTDSSTLNDLDEDSYANSQALQSSITANTKTTTEESEALTVVTSPLDSSSPKVRELPLPANVGVKQAEVVDTSTPSSSEKNPKTSQSTCTPSSTSNPSSSKTTPPRRSSQELSSPVTGSLPASQRKASDEFSYEEYVRALQQKITQISTARDSLDSRKQRRKSSKGEPPLTITTLNIVHTVIEPATPNPQTRLDDALPAATAAATNTSTTEAQPQQLIHKVPEIPSLTRRLEEITKERTKQKDLIHDLVMDKLQSKKQLNAEKRLHRSRQRQLLTSGGYSSGSSLSPTPKIAAAACTHHANCTSQAHYHISTAAVAPPISPTHVHYTTGSALQKSATYVSAYVPVDPLTSVARPNAYKQRPFSEHIDDEQLKAFERYKLNKTPSFSYALTSQMPKAPQNRDKALQASTENLRSEARARARLKSNSELGLSPEEKMQLLRKRLQFEHKIEHAAAVVPLERSVMTARERKMSASKSVNDLAYVASQQHGTTANGADFTSDPNLLLSSTDAAQAAAKALKTKTNRRHKDPERRKSLIQSLSSFFHKSTAATAEKKDDKAPVAGNAHSAQSERPGTSNSTATTTTTTTSNSTDGVFSRFRISPKTKEKSKDKEARSMSTTRSTPTTTVFPHERSNSQDCIVQNLATQKHQFNQPPQAHYQSNSNNKYSNHSSNSNTNSKQRATSSSAFSSSSPQLFVNHKQHAAAHTDDQIPPPIPPLPLNYQRSDDESYATETREQKKQRAISKAIRQAELKRLRIAQEIQREQEEIEVQLKELEARGVLIEKALRGEGQNVDNLDSTNNIGSNDEKLLKELLDIWRNSTQLRKRDEELAIRQKELQLEHRHAQLKEELNLRLSCNKLDKSSADVAAEGAILNEMLEIVAKRAALRPTTSNLDLATASDLMASTSRAAAGTVPNDGILLSNSRGQSHEDDESNI